MNSRFFYCLVAALMPVFVLANGLDSAAKKKKDNAQRSDSIHVIGHAHMDMNWLWTYSETMQMCNDNLRQTVAFMDEFPDFTMLQSQASVYNFVEMVDPPLLEKVKKYVKEGRLELGGGMWTEGDMNMSSGEAIARSFLLGQRYFQSHFGKMANIGWLPDNFGHISQMPQILKQAGCNYFYFHRTKPYIGTFWWVAPDSSKVLCYANDSYNGNFTIDFKKEAARFAPETHRILQIMGIGDHGGGPTRDYINRIHEMDRTPGYASVKFTTAENFFKKAEKEMAGRPTHRGEMQFIFEGCYTNVAEIKEGNRNSENLLFAGEFFNTLRWLGGDNYPAGNFRDLWTTVAFNEFHDILPGSAINEANKEAIARYAEVKRKATELRNNAFRKIADEVKFQQNMGQPVVAFNFQPFERKTIVEANVYSHLEPVTAKLNGWGNFYGSKYIIAKGEILPSVLVRDASGKTYPAQVVWGKSTPPGFTSKVQFIVNDMPAGGYKTFYIDMTKSGEYNKALEFKNNILETDYFKVKVDMKTGGIIGLFDKRSEKEIVKPGGQLNTLRIALEDKKGGMKSWVINKFVKQEDVTVVKSVKIVETGPVRTCIETVKTWGKSRFIGRTYIYRSYPRIDYDMEVHWLETGSDSTDSPMLRAVFPINVENPKFYSQVPFDVVERPVDGMINGLPAPLYLTHQEAYGIKAEVNNGQEVPAQKWVDVSNGKAGVALLSKTKYGFSYHEGDLRLTLLRSAGEPDIYPNLGKFDISYSIFPHEGDWENGVWAEGDNFNVPVYAAEPPSLALVKEHATRPQEASLISVDAKNVVLSGMKQSEEGDELIIRLFETEGKETKINLKLPVKVVSARRMNIIELPLSNAVTPVVSENSVSFTVKPHEIVTIGIKK